MNDDELTAALTSLWAAVDPVPAAARQAADAAIEWRDLDSELAQLTSETGLDRELAHVRGEAPRLLSFTSGSTVIELEISVADGLVRLLGQLEPAQEADVTVQSTGWSHGARADGRGRFSLDALPEGRMRVAVSFDRAGERSTTEWFVA